MTNTALKAQIDSQITNETTAASITPTDVGTNLKAVVDYVDQQSSLFIYASTLDQTGTSAPTNVSTKNNTEFDFVWSRTTTGTYFLTCDTDLSPYFCILHISNSTYASNLFTITKIGNTFRVRTYDNGTGTPILSDDLLSGATFKIEFYI